MDRPNCQATPVPGEPAHPETEAEPAQTFFRGSALIVEDNAIIALGTEAMLIELGFQSCVVTGSIGAAIEAIRSKSISFAMLDIIVGEASSEPVAHAQRARSIPFVFASGYGDGTDMNGDLADVPFVPKPFASDDIAAELMRLSWPSPASKRLFRRRV